MIFSDPMRTWNTGIVQRHLVQLGLLKVQGAVGEAKPDCSWCVGEGNLAEVEIAGSNMLLDFWF